LSTKELQYNATLEEESLFRWIKDKQIERDQNATYQTGCLRTVKRVTCMILLKKKRTGSKQKTHLLRVLFEMDTLLKIKIKSTDKNHFIIGRKNEDPTKPSETKPKVKKQ
jgi:hypothetical protein